MRFLLLLCLILSVVAAIQMQTSHAVNYIVTNTAVSTPGGIRFSTEIGDDETVKALMDSATNFIWTTFQQTDPADNKDVLLVSLFIIEMDDVLPPAYTNNDEIYFNALYIEGFSGDVQTEFMGILYHEMTHVWQWTGNGKAPTGLYEGIADYITLKAYYARSFWPKEYGHGDNWDDGYAVTAYFLDYCNCLREGFVGELNMMMKYDYNVNYFYLLLTKSVEDLWNDYQSAYSNGGSFSCVIS